MIKAYAPPQIKLATQPLHLQIIKRRPHQKQPNCRPQSMETATRSRRLRLHLRPCLALLSTLRRLLSLVALRELLLTLSLRLHGLRPHTVHLPDTNLHIWSPARPNPSKPTLLLIHGFGGNSKWQWERQIPRLSKFFNLYVPDLVFFGESTTGSEERSVGFQARCVGEAMRRLGVERYAVVGISYGGFVAYRMAAELGEAVVGRVVVMTAGVCATEEQKRELVGREERDVCELLLPRRPEDLMGLMRRSMCRPPKWVPTFLLRDCIETMYKDHRKEKEEMLKELLLEMGNSKPLPVLNQETLILWGDQDCFFPIELGHQLLRHLGSKAKLEVIKDAGHALQLEQPDIVNHFIERFVLDTYVNTSN